MRTEEFGGTIPRGSEAADVVRYILGSDRIRPSSIALALGLAVALGLLYVIDRSVAQNARTQAQLEVVESAALMEGFLAVHAQALQSLRGLSGGQDGALEFQELVEALNIHAPNFRRVWVADTNGIVRYEHLFDEQGSLVLRDGDLDTVRVLGVSGLMAGARSTRQFQVSAPGPTFTGERGFVLLEPLYRSGAFIGFAGGEVTSEALLRRMEGRRVYRSGRILVMHGADTIAVSPNVLSMAGPVTTTRADIRTPGDAAGVWEIIAVRPRDDVRLRVLLWGVGLATILSVALVMRDERRQAQRLAERTTELERLSTELLRANRAKSEFLANVSHELRTPLNAIVGFVDLLRDGVYGELGSRQIGPVERIASSAGHLRQLVDQVLDIAKMAAGRLEMHPEPIDLRVFVLDVVSEVEALIAERGLNLSIAIPTTLPRVESDPLHLRQILMNLLGNALQYTPSGGVAVRGKLVYSAVELEHGPQSHGDVRSGGGQWVMLQVADSGIGIAPNDRERIFEEFEQINAGPRGDSMRRGTGLGLAISRRLARLLGGDITVESELGKGSTFTVWLPVSTLDFAASDDAPAPHRVA
jgi:signal transduction histidine kinase